MKVLFIDTETTGIPLKNVNLDDVRQPRLVQLAALMHDEERRERHAVSVLVNPAVAIPKEASDVHGITTDEARRFGIPERGAIGILMRLLAASDIVSGYNVEFDLTMAKLASAREKVTLPLAHLEVRDTCHVCAPIVNLPPTARMIEFGFGHKSKTPKLIEAYSFFFGETLAGAHDALADARAAARVYYELVRRGVWSPEGWTAPTDVQYPDEAHGASAVGEDQGRQQTLFDRRTS